MDKLNILKFLLSDINRIPLDKPSSLFEGQKMYYESDMILNFNPLLWFSKNINNLIQNNVIQLLFKQLRYPVGMLHENNALMKEGYITEEHQVNICNLAILGVQKKYIVVEEFFDPLFYFYLYHNQIEHYFSYLEVGDLTNEDKACMFYCCYGYFCNLHFVSINPLQYIASYPELITTFGIDETNGAMHFFQHGNLIKFDPIVYVASNFNDSTVKEFVNCIGIVDEQRAIKHYIRKGFSDKLKHDSFDEWKYLANNPQRICKVLRKNVNNKKKIEYDVFMLTKRNIAADFIKKKGKQKTNVFDSVKFVKRYIDDNEYVNKNKKLSIENAAEYFVKYYVISEKIRYESSLLYQLSLFLQNRAIDSAKQIPYNATRYIVETKFL